MAISSFYTSARCIGLHGWKYPTTRHASHGCLRAGARSWGIITTFLNRQRAPSHRRGGSIIPLSLATLDLPDPPEKPVIRALGGLGFLREWWIAVEVSLVFRDTSYCMLDRNLGDATADDDAFREMRDTRTFPYSRAPRNIDNPTRKCRSC